MLTSSVKELDYITLFCVFYAVFPSLAPLPVKFCAGPNTAKPRQLSQSGWSWGRGLAQPPGRPHSQGMLSETPEHSALWGPWLCQESHLPREEQLSVHLSTCWPKGDRQGDETSLKPRQGSAAKTAAVATPESKAPSVTATAGRRRQKGAKVTHSNCSVVRH